LRWVVWVCRGLRLLRCEDDLTHKLVEIIRANITLRRMISNGSPQHILNEYVSLLQVRTYTLVGVVAGTVPDKHASREQ
jgi:DNA-directed RNA polymerase II subunit RPB1